MNAPSPTPSAVVTLSASSPVSATVSIADRSPRRRIVLAAQHYLLGKRDCDCRFDCVLIDGEKLEWIKNAFSADD